MGQHHDGLSSRARSVVRKRTRPRTWRSSVQIRSGTPSSTRGAAGSAPRSERGGPRFEPGRVHHLGVDQRRGHLLWEQVSPGVRVPPPRPSGQAARAPGSEPGERRFESDCPDHQRRVAQPGVSACLSGHEAAGSNPATPISCACGLTEGRPASTRHGAGSIPARRACR